MEMRKKKALHLPVTMDARVPYVLPNTGEQDFEFGEAPSETTLFLGTGEKG